MTTNDSSTPKKAENAQVQAVRKEFTVSGDEQNLDPAALGSRSPLELLADWLEAEAACDGTREASVLAVLTRGRLRELNPAALRAQAEAGTAVVDALNLLVYLNDNVPPPEARTVRASMAWSKARAALGQAGTVGGTP